MAFLFLRGVTNIAPLLTKFPGYCNIISFKHLRTVAADAKKIQSKLPKSLSTISVYMKENYARIKSENPDKRSTEMFKIVALQYKNLSADQLKKYKADSEKSKALYKKVKESLTEKEKNSLLVNKRMKKEKKTELSASKMLKSLKAEHNYPVIKGKTPFALFLIEKHPTFKDSKLPVVERGRKIAQMYNDLPQDAKIRYVENAKIMRLRHNEAVAKWEGEMKKKNLAHVLEEMKRLSKEKNVAGRHVEILNSGKPFAMTKKPAKPAIRGRPKVAKLKRKIAAKPARKRRIGVKVNAVKRALKAKKSTRVAKKAKKPAKTVEKAKKK